MKLTYSIRLPEKIRGTKIEAQIKFEDPNYAPLAAGNYSKVGEQIKFLRSFINGFNFSLEEDTIFCNYTLSFAKNWGFTVLLVPQYDHFNFAVVRLDIENNVVRVIPHHSVRYIEPFDIVELLPNEKIYSYPVELYLAFLEWWLPIKEALAQGDISIPLTGEFEWDEKVQEPASAGFKRALIDYGQVLLQKKYALRDLCPNDWDNEQIIAAWEQKIQELTKSPQEQIYAEIQKLLDKLIDIEAEKEQNNEELILRLFYEFVDKKQKAAHKQQGISPFVSR